MYKILKTFLLIIVLSVSLQINPSFSEPALVLTLLDGVEITGASASSTFGQRREHTTQVVFTNSGGSLTALILDLEGSLDGISWFQLDTKTFSSAEITAKGTMFHTVNRVVGYIRVNITTLTETGTTAVTVKYLSAKWGL